ncbi:MAG TPA: CPBP family intramembrane metalloprotease [Thermoflexia bacterium]|nr:CPBP family intramembrane metalloprotease [Thermoflexia bacterium]
MKAAILALLKRHAFIVFVTLTVLISWFPWYTRGVGFLVFGPSIAGLVMIALTSGKKGLRDLGQRALRWRVGFLWWAVALFFTGLTLLLSIAINTIWGGTLPSFTFFRQEWYLIPVFFLLTIIGGPLGEEFGWRGFALPHLQRQWGAMAASIVIGIVWALWHLPLFFQSDSIHYQIGLSLLPIYVVGEIVLAIIITWVYNQTGSSLLVGGIILHNADNFWATTLLTTDTLTSAFQGGAQSQLDMQLYIVSTAVGALVALTLAIATKWQLGLSAARPKSLQQSGE